MMLYTLLAAALVSSAYAASSYGGGPIPHLKVAGIVNPPFLNAADSSGKFSGFIAELWAAIAEAGSFTYDFSVQPDNAYGDVRQDGSITGLLARIASKEIDVGAADFTITQGREKVFDYMHPFYRSQNRVIVNPADTGSINYLVRPDFTTLEWLRTATADPKIVAIQANIQANLPGSQVASYDAGIQQVLKGGYGLLIDLPDGNRLVKANPGKLKLRDDVLFTKYFAFVLQQGSPLLENLNLAYENVCESGQYQLLLDKYDLNQ
jgi:ABC-type amino acid transport substrate-binding protein